MSAAKRKTTNPIDVVDAETVPEFVLDVQGLAKARGINHAYDLWKRIGGSLETAADIWNGRTVSITFRGERNMLGRLCAVLQCKPARLLKEVKPGDN